MSSKIVGCLSGGRIFAKAKKAKKDGADAVELRIDLIRNYQKINVIAERIRKELGLEIIVTVRHPKESGCKDIDKTFNKTGCRKKIYMDLLRYCRYIDIELSSADKMIDVIKTAKKKKIKVILSYHNFKTMPDLNKILNKMKKYKCDICKIAGNPKSDKDIIKMLGLLTKTKDDIVLIAMGKKYSWTRILFHLLGNKLTYCSVEKTTAPGQVSVKELRSY